MMDTASYSNNKQKHHIEAEQQRLLARRRTMRRYIIIVVSSIVRAGVVAAAVMGTRVSSKVDPNTSQLISLATAVKAVCSVTLHKHFCFDSLMSSGPITGHPDELFKLSLLVSLHELNKTSQQLQLGRLVWSNWNNASMTKLALENCEELLGMAIDQVKDSIALLPACDFSHISTDLKTPLSAAATYQDTCLDGFEFASEDIRLRVSC